ncbi:hypothetical protein ACLK2F_14150 [Escherichia coli]
MVKEVLRHRNFASLSLPGLSEERKTVFVPGLAILCGVFDALAIRELRLSDGALREGVLYEMEGRFRHQDVRSGPPAASPTSIASTASGPTGAGYHYANVRTVAGTATGAWRIRNWRRYCDRPPCCMRSG